MYVNDQWNITDELGMEQAGDGLAKMVLNVTAPFTIAVTGKWGAGKTSTMRRAFATLGGNPIKQAIPLEKMDKAEVDLQDWFNQSILPSADLNNKNKYEERRTQLGWENSIIETAEKSLCIWFSPWQHQNADNPIVPLLLEIQNQFLLRYKLKKKSNTALRRGGLAAMTLLERVADLALVLSGDKAVFKGTTEAVKKAWQDSENPHTKLTDGQRFHLMFEDAIETALHSLVSSKGGLQDRDRLIIFIDDLDRCEGEVVVSLLEAIKLYLGTKRCVFVLGVDNTAILSALNAVWENRSEDNNREYLEKLFQATLRVPAPTVDKAQQMLATQLKENQIPDAEKWAKVIVELLEPNPRKLKNFSNSLCAFWNVYTIPETEEQIRRLILFLYLNLYHPAVWRILERQRWSLRILKYVLDEASGAEVVNCPQLDKDSQRMMEQFFSQAFSHVLKHDNTDPLADDKHRGLSLEKSVELFLERIDRKSSDEYFVVLARQTFTADDEVDEHFLSITQTPSTSPETPTAPQTETSTDVAIDTPVKPQPKLPAEE